MSTSTIDQSHASLMSATLLILHIIFYIFKVILGIAILYPILPTVSRETFLSYELTASFS